MKAEWD